MIRRSFLPFAVAIPVLVAHAGYTLWHAQRVASQWATVGPSAGLSSYIATGDVFLGLSYALAAAFTTYALLRTLQGRKSGTAGLVGGVTLTGLLYVGGCFLIGCCGSPMLPIYLGLFGSKFLGVTKPLVFGLTVLSVAGGWWWMERRSRKTASCCEGCNCHE